MTTLLAPSLRQPRRCNLAAQLSSWLDNEEVSRVGVSSRECAADLERLEELRLEVEQAFRGGYDTAVASLHVLQEYGKALEDCEQRGFPSGSDAASSIELAWESTRGDVEVYSTLTWDRVNVVWNLAALYVFQASQISLERLKDYEVAGGYLDSTIVLLGHLQGSLLPMIPTNSFSVEMTADYVGVVKACVTADCQRVAGYSKVSNKPRPIHPICAKLASGCVTLYQKADTVTQHQPWADATRTASMHMSALCEYHQSQVHRTKHQSDMELARIEAAREYASLCIDFCDAADPYGLGPRTLELLAELDARRTDLPESMSVRPEDLTPIPPQIVVNTQESSMELLLPPLQVPLFASILDAPTRRAVNEVHEELFSWLSRVSSAADDKTDVGQRTLQILKLPSAITAYRQSQQGGGIPQDIWLRIKDLQDKKMIQTLKQQLWSLKETSDYASATLGKVESTLKDNLEMDKHFRVQYPGYDGYNVQELQDTLSKTLDNYKHLMSSAQSGDDMILNRLDDLDKDVRFRLVSCKRCELDRLIPDLHEREIDLTRLEYHLGELSELFKQRERLLDELNSRIDEMDIVGPYRTAMEKLGLDTHPEIVAADISQSHFKSLHMQLQQNMDSQNPLLRLIKEENEIFMQQRTMSHALVAGEKTITLLHDAIEELDMLSKHLQEGQSFYDMFIPKLEALHGQVEHLADRLMDARGAYADSKEGKAEAPATAPPAAATELPMQDSADSYGIEFGSARKPAARATAARPSADDEQVANLVSMGFDHARVVDALTSHDNNFEEALNELLVG